MIFSLDGQSFWIKTDNLEQSILEYFPNDNKIEESHISADNFAYHNQNIYSNLDELTILDKAVIPVPLNDGLAHAKFMGISRTNSLQVDCILPYGYNESRYSGARITTLADKRLLIIGVGKSVEVMQLSDSCNPQLDAQSFQDEYDRLKRIGVRQLADGLFEAAEVNFWELFSLGRYGCDRLVQAEALLFINDARLLVRQNMLGHSRGSRHFYKLALSAIQNTNNPVLTEKIISRLENNDVPEEYEQIVQGSDFLYARSSEFPDPFSELDALLEQQRETNDQKGEADTLRAIAQLHQLQGYRNPDGLNNIHSLDALIEALSIYTDLEMISEQADIYHDLGDVHRRSGDFDNAARAYSNAFSLYQKTEEIEKYPLILNRLGDMQFLNYQNDEALESYKMALEFCQNIIVEGCLNYNSTIFFFKNIWGALNNIGEIYVRQRNYVQALEYFKRSGSLTAFNNIGWIYAEQGNYIQALDFFQPEQREALHCGGYGAPDRSDASLAEQIKRAVVGDEGVDTDYRTCQSESIFSISSGAEMYRLLGQNKRAIAMYQKAISNIRTANPLVGENDFSQQEISIYNNLGLTYKGVGEYRKALDSFQRSLLIRQISGDTLGQGISFNNIGEIYRHQGKYAEALQTYKQALSIFEEAENLEGKAATLHNFGVIYDELGQGDRALAHYQQALQIRTEITDLKGQGDTLNNMALVQVSQGNLDQAEASYQIALSTRQEAQDSLGEATTLNNLALFYLEKGQPDQALAPAQQALEIYQRVNNPPGEGNTFDTLGRVYVDLGQYDNAEAAYQQALVILRQTGNRTLERIVLSNLGDLLVAQEQEEVAIAFYKQSVNLTEEIRRDLQVLPLDQQKSYTETVADTYRTLADLLIEQGRLLEALQVIELLKFREIQDYARSRNTSAGVDQFPEEEQAASEYFSLIQLGADILQCEANSTCSQDQLIRLKRQRTERNRQYNDAVRALGDAIRDRRAADDIAPNPKDLIAESVQTIVNAQPGTVLIYPVVLNDKLLIMWATRGGLAQPIEVEGVTERQLNEAVFRFHELMAECEFGGCNAHDIPAIQAVSQQLYDWLMPNQLRAEFAENDIQNLVFALDRAVRYVPMAALFDGEQYLIENFTVSTVTAAWLSQADTPLPTDPEAISVMALGLSEAVPDVDPNDDVFGFNALPNVEAEVNAIVQKTDGSDDQGIYNGQEHLNQAFDGDTFYKLAGHNILHIATHGVYMPTNLYSSYLMLGTKEDWRIAQIQDLAPEFRDLSMVVLSACETALGGRIPNVAGTLDPDGREISGIAQTFIDVGVDTVIASLWQVNDASTSELMQSFYAALSGDTVKNRIDSSVDNGPQQPITIAQAMRSAQLSLLYGDKGSPELASRNSARIIVVPRPGSVLATTPTYAHPYYWSAFTVIGNGL
ncbi:MAG: tetratricopeptide repeat protein [Cyanobacteria bacterium P01_F01_bin.150]